MHVFITGSSGFVGSHLVSVLLEKGHRVTGMARHPSSAFPDHPEFRFVEGDGTEEGKWQEAVREADAVVNLAGVSIFRRWSEKTKKAIYDSRILTTRNLVAALPEKKEVILCSTSAVGFYGPRGEEPVDESASAGDDFLAGLSVDWENEALAAEKKGARVVIDRFGIVLGKNGGAFANMLPAFRMFVGGPIGSGRQWFPWIHLDDLLSAHLFVLENPDAKGPVNFTAPNPVRNQELADSLGKVLGRPSFFRVPGFVLKTAAGEFGEVLLKGQYVVPKRLLDMGFSFRYPELEGALRDLAG
jgi:hypothetical protein